MPEKLTPYGNTIEKPDPEEKPEPGPEAIEAERQQAVEKPTYDIWNPPPRYKLTSRGETLKRISEPRSYDPANDTPYKSRAEALRAMKDWDRLGKGEQWLTEHMPAIGGSLGTLGGRALTGAFVGSMFGGIGLGTVIGAGLGAGTVPLQNALEKANKDFSETWGGKLLYGLDMPAEGIERTVGLAAQGIAHMMDVEGADAVFEGETPVEQWNSFRDAWAAGGMQWDLTPKMTPTFRGELGEDFLEKSSWGWFQPSEFDPPGTAGVIRARKQIDLLVSQGWSRSDAILRVRSATYADAGALAIRMQTNDLVGHVAADPLDWVLGAIRPIEMLNKRAIEAVTKAMPLPLMESSVQIARASGRMDEVNHLLDLHQQSGKALGLRDKMSLFLTGRGRVAAAMAEDITGMASKDLPWYMRGYVDELAESKIFPFNVAAKQLALTPDAKAYEAMNIVGDTVVGNFHRFKTPEAKVNYLRNFAEGMLGKEFGHTIISVEGKAAQAVAKGAIRDANALYNTFNIIGEERRLLSSAAAILGDEWTEVKVLEEFVQNGEELLMRKLAQSGDEAAGELVNMFADDTIRKNLVDIAREELPFTDDLFDLHLRAQIIDTAEEIAVNKFGVQQMGLIRKGFEAMKAGETLAYLRLNPGFPVRNLLNNEMTMIGRGLNPLVSPAQLDDFLDEIGYVPMRFEEAYTMTADTLVEGARKGIYKPGSTIRDAMIGEEQFLDKMRDWINGRELGPGDMGDLSKKIEASSSRRAFFSGYKQAWRDYFWRPGAGFTPASQFFGDDMARALGNDIINHIEGSVKDAKNIEDLDKIFASDDITVSISKLVEQVEEKTGIQISGVYDEVFIEKLGRELDGALRAAKQADDPQVLTRYFDEVREGFQNHLDELANERKLGRVGYAKTLTEAEGPLAIPTLVADSVDDLAYTHVGHAMRMRNVDPSNLAPEARSIFWRRVLSENRRTFGRHWDRFDDTISGMKQAAEKIGMKWHNDLDDAFTTYRKTWDDFYDARDMRYRNHEEALDAGKTPEMSWDEILRKNDEDYLNAMRAEQRALRQVDDNLTALLDKSSPELAEAFSSWRAEMRKMRMANREKTTAFLEDVRKIINPADKNVAYKEYWRSVVNDWQEVSKAQRAGLAAMYGDDEMAQRILNQSQASERNASLNRQIANRFKLPTVSEYGAPMQDRIRDTVNKYLRGQYGAMGKRGMELTGAEYTSLGKTAPDVDELNDVFGNFSETKVVDLKNARAMSAIDRSEVRSMSTKIKDADEWAGWLIDNVDDPIGAAVHAWAYSGERYHKEALKMLVNEFPEEAKQIQDFTHWYALNKYGSSVDAYPKTVELWRAAKSGKGVRPWDSVTTSREYAERLVRESDEIDTLYRLEVPTQNLFTGEPTHPGFVWGEEAEFILNEAGIQDSFVFKIADDGEELIQEGTRATVEVPEGMLQYEDITDIPPEVTSEALYHRSKYYGDDAFMPEGLTSKQSTVNFSEGYNNNLAKYRDVMENKYLPTANKKNHVVVYMSLEDESTLSRYLDRGIPRVEEGSVLPNSAYYGDIPSDGETIVALQIDSTKWKDTPFSHLEPGSRIALKSDIPSEDILDVFKTVDAGGQTIREDRIIKRALANYHTDDIYDTLPKEYHRLIDDMRNDYLLREHPMQSEPFLTTDDLVEESGKHFQPKQGARTALGQGGPPDMDAIADQSYALNGGLVMDELERGARKQFETPPIKFTDVLDEGQQQEVLRYIANLKGEMTDARRAATKMGEFRRDSALLNYRRRRGFNNTLGMVYPYEYWMTGSMMRWAMHSIDRPGMLTNYLRLKKMFNTSVVYDQNMPSRLKQHVRLPLFSPPSFMGDAYYVDPLGIAFPFDQMAYPLEKAKQDKQSLEYKATDIIRAGIESGQYTAHQGQNAIRDQSGKIWENALLRAQQTEQTGGAMSVLETFSSPHAPISWGIKALTGRQDEIGPSMPLSRTTKQVFGLLGSNPVTDNNMASKVWGVGASIRKKLGLPAFDKYEDYRIDRAISNMVANGEASTREGLEAMITREGKLFQEAGKRAAAQYAKGTVVEGTAKERASSVAAATLDLLGIPIKTYPVGEQKQRQLKDDFSRAYNKYETSGDYEDLNKFFEANPEYETRLALWKTPQERMQQFLVDEAWDAWNNMAKIDRKQVVKSLGREFESKFLNKETRDYAEIDTNQFATWVKMMGGDPPGTLGDDAEPIQFAPREVAWTAEQFYRIRQKAFPDFYKLQNKYFKLSDSAQIKFLRDNPQLEYYWNWRNDFLHKNPNIVPFVSDTFELQYDSVEEMEEAFATKTPNLSYTEWRLELGTSETNLVIDAFEGGQLPPDLREYLSKKAERLGYDSLDDLITEVGQAYLQSE